MKTRHIIMMALAALFAASCTEWDAPTNPKAGQDHYGNPSLEATNLVTIAQLKSTYSSAINNNGLEEVTEPMQIQGVVVGNDQGGNIYQSIYVQDETGGIAISISQSGLYGAFSVGQCILIELKGLYIGGYGQQPQIGTTYVNPTSENASAQIGRMSRYLWAQHYKLISPIANLEAKPEVKGINDFDFDRDCGKLVTLRGVVLSEADGNAVFAPDDESVTLTSNCANRSIKGATNIVVRTSTYADFAKEVMPTGRVDITGIATRYRDTWQILMRTFSDIQPSTADESEGGEPSGPTGEGTLASPFNVAAAIAKCTEVGTTGSSEMFYIKGKVASIKEAFSSQYGNATFNISDDGSTNNAFTAYRVLYLGNKKFTDSDTQIKVGDEVIIYGKIMNYSGNTPETVQGSAYLYALNGKTADGDAPSQGDAVAAKGTGTQADPYNVAGVLKYIETLGADKSSPNDVYVKGKVKAIKEQFGTQYGNATFTMVDEGSSAVFTAYRVLYLGNAKYTSGDVLKENDEVIVCGKVVNYKGNTPETVQGSAYLYALNGKTADGDAPSQGDAVAAKGTGTQADPYNVAGVLKYIETLGADKNSPNDVYVKGKVKAIKEQFGTQYGNATFTMVDEGSSAVFTAYRLLYLGNTKYTSGEVLKENDEVIVCGKVVNYKGNTPETVQGAAYLYSLNGQTK